jgi:SAM-dependent methyltransferase
VTHWSGVDDQRQYWDRTGSQKTFTHPIEHDWLARFVKSSDRILDYGCGYGRIVRELADIGYANSIGVDFSTGMIARGRRLYPELDLRAVDALPVPDEEASFDVVLLFAVLTCIPDDGAQQAVISECRRLLRDGGLLYISDMPLQRTDDYRARYERGVAKTAAYGVFETSDGAIVRHHDEGRLQAWLSRFELLDRRDMDITTMNGTPCKAVQLLASKSG